MVGYTFKKETYVSLLFKTEFFVYILEDTGIFFPEPAARLGTGQDWTGSTTLGE